MIVVDEVEIVNVKGDSVASEETLLALLETMKKMASSKGFDPKDVDKKVKDLANNLDSLVDIVTENTDALEDNTDANEDNTDAVKRSTISLTNMASYIAGNTIGSLIGFTKKLISGGETLTDFASEIPMVGSLLAPITGYFDDTMQSFRKMSSVGAAFNNSLQDVRMAAAETYMTLDQFTNFVSNNSEKLAALGGTATSGAKSVSTLTKSLGDQRLELLNMGFTFEDINESMLDYAYLTRNQGRIEQRNAAEVAASAAEYMKTLQTLSKLTGKSVDQLKDEQAATRNDLAFQLKMSKMSETERAKAESLLLEAQAGGPVALARAKEMIMGLPPMTRETQLFAATMSDSEKALRERTAAMSDETISNKRFIEGQAESQAKLIAGMVTGATNLEQVLAAGSAAGDGVGSEILQMLQKSGVDLAKYIGMSGEQLETQIANDIKAAKAESNKRDALTNSIVDFENTVKNTRESIQTAMIDSGVFDLVADSVKYLADLLSDPAVMGKFEEAIKDITSFFENFIQTVKTDGLWNAIKDAFSDVITSMKTYLFGASADEQKQQATTKVGELSTRRENLQSREQEISRQIDATVPGSTGFSTKRIQQLEAEREAIRTQSNNLASEIGNLENQLEGTFENIPGVINGALAGIIPSILGGIGNTLSTGIKDLFSGNITTSAMVTAIAGLWAAPKVINAIGGISNLFGSNQGADLDRSSDRRGPTRGSRTAGGRLGSNIGGALGGFTGGIIEGVGNGLAAVGAKAPLVVAGAAAVGAAIVAIGAGLAGATWLMGAALPTFAEGMKSFEDIDGAALRDAALGMTAIAVAMAAFGVGSAVSGLGNLIGTITNGLASLFPDGEDPMEQLQRFAKYDIDAVKVENNARAMVAFSGALAASGGAQAASGIGNLVGGITSYLGGLFGPEDPLDKLVRFSKYDINADKVIANSNALTAFSKAMTFSAGSQAASGIGDLIDGLLGGLGRLFGAEDPLDKLVRFSNYNINTEKVKQNAEALAAFSNALQNFPELDSERVGGLFGAIGFIFSGSITMPWDRVNEFGEANIKVDGVIANAKAISAFSNAFANFPELDIDSERVGGLFGAIGRIFSGKLVMPWDRVNEFGEANIKVDGVIANAKAISAFSNAFANFPELDSERVGGLFGAIGRIFSGKLVMPWDRVNEFGNAKINADGVTANAKVVSAFSNAFANFPEIDSERVGGLFASIRSIFSGEIVMPWDRVNEFGNAKINGVGVATNAVAIKAFASAFQNFPEINGERVGGFFSWIAEQFAGSIIMPWDKVREFGEVDINVDGVIANASAMRAFGNALSGFSNFKTSELDLPDIFTNNLVQISNITGNGLQNIASGLESIVGVTGVRDQLDAINEGLDPAGIRTYTDAIDQLVERLNELNEVLSESNDTLFKDNQSAADVLGNIKVSTQGSSEGISQLNTMLSQMLTVLTQSKEIENKIERNTASLSSDTLSGRVSRMR